MKANKFICISAFNLDDLDFEPDDDMHVQWCKVDKYKLDTQKTVRVLIPIGTDSALASRQLSKLANWVQKNPALISRVIHEPL
jgi:hypothetical protein